MSNARTDRSRLLADHVDTFWQSHAYVQPHASERIMPTASVDVVIDIGNPKCSVASGVRATSAILDTSRPLTLFGIRLKAGGAAAVLGMPAVELRDTVVPLQEVWSWADEFIERLASTSELRARVMLAEDLLASHLCREWRADPVIGMAASMWRSAQSTASVESMAAKLGCSVRRLCRGFSEQAGVSPKLYARIMRFQESLQLISAVREPDWAAVAAHAGYYDQAHFNHDFRKFAGLSPSEYIGRRTAHRNHIVAG